MATEMIYLHLSGPTASFRIPTSVTAAQLALTVPAYSSILGMLSYACGREVTPKDTRIGYKYSYEHKGMDLETFHRWERRDSGTYGYNATSIRNREIHYNINLQLIISNLELFDELYYPSRQLTFGRSQDLATLESIKIVNAKETKVGNLYGSLLPIELDQQPPGTGIFHNLPEYFQYYDGKIRRPRNSRPFLALSQHDQTVSFDNLFNIDLDIGNEETFYLHQWLEVP